jgi:hypothetical protein
MYKTVLFFIETRSIVAKQRWFRAYFQTKRVSSFKTIHELYNQFNNDGSVLERKCRQPSSVCFPENTDTVKSGAEKELQ